MDCTGVQISEVSLLAKHCFTLLSCPACFLKKETVAHQKIRPAPVLNFRLGQKKTMAPPNVPTLDRVGFSFWQVGLSLSRRKAIWQPNVLPNFDTQFFYGCWSVRRVPDTSPTPFSFPNSGGRRPHLTLTPLRGGTWAGPAAWPMLRAASGSCPLGTGGTSGRAGIARWIFSSVKARPVACRHVFV